MAVAAVVLARDLGELAHLARAQRAVGDGDPQHVGMELQIEPVHQPVRPELLLGQLAGEAARDLVAELLDARVDEGLIEVVIMIHGRPPPTGRGRERGASPCACLPRSRRIVGPAARIASRSALGTTCPFRVSTAKGVDVDDDIARRVLERARGRRLGRGGVRQNRGAVEVLAPARVGGLKHDHAIREAVGGDDIGHGDLCAARQRRLT